MKYIKLFENYDDSDDEDYDSSIVFFHIKGDEGESVVSLQKQDGKWREYLEAGDEPYGFGGKNYQSYLKPEDLLSWLRKDYGDVKIISADEAEGIIEELRPNK